MHYTIILILNIVTEQTLFMAHRFHGFTPLSRFIIMAMTSVFCNCITQRRAQDRAHDRADLLVAFFVAYCVPKCSAYDTPNDQTDAMIFTIRDWNLLDPAGTLRRLHSDGLKDRSATDHFSFFKHHAAGMACGGRGHQA
jgi:hypothetical protein